MTLGFGRDTHGTPVPQGVKCPECPEGVPTLFPSRNGTSRGCPVEVGKGVPCVPVYQTGHRNPGPLGRTPRPSIHHCGRPILTALDADRCALTVTLDPWALNALGEVEAIRAGRHTYQIKHRSIEPRHRWNIPGKPPGPERIVLAEHACTDMPNHWRQPSIPKPAPQPLETGCPF